MAATLLELTTDIVTSHASVSAMTTDELIQEIQKVYNALQNLEKAGPEPGSAEETKAPVLSLKKAFQADQVFCMVCGKGVDKGVDVCSQCTSENEGKPKVDAGSLDDIDNW